MTRETLYADRTSIFDKHNRQIVRSARVDLTVSQIALLPIHKGCQEPIMRVHTAESR